MGVINNIRFNQTKDCASIATSEGFMVYSLTPFKKIIERPIQGGLELVQMLNNTGLFVLIGNGKNIDYPSNKLFIWNENTEKIELDIEYNDIVKNIKIRSDILVVVLEYKTILYEMLSYKRIKEMRTYNNPLGLVTINYSLTHNKKLRLVTPGINIGYVDIWDKYGEEPLKSLKVHNNKLECINLNNNGEYLATASHKGTIIRIYNINDYTIVKEFRRGIYSKMVYTLSFNQYANLLLCNTKCGDIDIFETGLNSEIMEFKKKGFFLNWSVGSYSLDGILARGCFINDRICMIGYNGKYYQFTYTDGLKLYNILNLFFGDNCLITN